MSDTLQKMLGFFSPHCNQPVGVEAPEPVLYQGKILPAPPKSTWFPWSPQSYDHAASHHLMPGAGRSHKHQRLLAALPGCSPHHGSFHSLGNGVSTFSWLAPSASQVWGGPTPSQSTTHQVSLHKQEGFFHPSFSGKALLKQHFRDNSVFP